MGISNDLKNKITSSLLIRSDVKKNILNNWDKLNKKTQENIIQMVDLSNEWQDYIFNKALKNNLGFTYDIKNMLRTESIKTLRKIEQDDKWDHMDLDSAFNKL